jgi:hypothetical protein
MTPMVAHLKSMIEVQHRLASQLPGWTVGGKTLTGGCVLVAVSRSATHHG